MRPSLWQFRPALLAALLLLGACHDHDRAPPAAGPATPVTTATPDYWPTAGWQPATPESQGFAPGSLDSLAADAATALPYHTSLLVIRNGWLVHESYHDTPSEAGNNADTKHHVWSITKSVTSMTVGRALTLGDLSESDLDSSAGDTFPDEAVGPLAADDPRRDISLRHALQMRSGLAWNEPAWLLNEEARKDPLLRVLNGLEPACPFGNYLVLCGILQQPLAYEPGTVWNYNTYDSYLISAFFTSLTSISLNQYALDNLFTPLGIAFDLETVITADTDWPSFLGPITFGGGLLSITARDLGRLGMVMLYDGRWNGEQLVSSDWVAQSTTAQGAGQIALFSPDGNPRPIEASDPVVDIPYALQWWRVTGPGLGGTPSLSGRGLGGQMMHIFKDKELIIIITCDSDVLSGREADINNFLKSRILDQLAI